MSPETFDADWLAIRESADHRSRAGELLPPLREWWSAAGRTRVLDLGAGAGSNLRYLAPELPGPQEWTLVDHDQGLMSRARPPVPNADVSTRCQDLREDLGGLVRSSHLVTASALLDLVSEAWLSTLAEVCAEARAGAIFALSYDGRVAWSGEADPADAAVLAAVNRHQQGDKGFGPALGPAAGPAADAVFRAHGYRTWLRPSPWVLESTDAELVRALVAGWAGVATDMRPGEQAQWHEWADRRSADVAEGRTRLRVGHWDLLALPPDGAGP